MVQFVCVCSASEEKHLLDCLLWFPDPVLVSHLDEHWQDESSVLHLQVTRGKAWLNAELLLQDLSLPDRNVLLRLVLSSGLGCAAAGSNGPFLSVESGLCDWLYSGMRALTSGGFCGDM